MSSDWQIIFNALSIIAQELKQINRNLEKINRRMVFRNNTGMRKSSRFDISKNDSGE